jgi:hypothetical protein
MKILMWSSAIFAFSFLLHIVIWKIRIPRRQTSALLRIFMGTMAVAFGALFHWGSTGPEAAGSVPLYLHEYLQITFFHVSLTLAYVITYSALEADSPTLVIVKAIADAGPEGLGKELLYDKLTDDILVRPRVDDLVRDELAVIEDGKYRLTRKGRSFIGIFVLYRKLLGAPLRGG